VLFIFLLITIYDFLGFLAVCRIWSNGKKQARKFPFILGVEREKRYASAEACAIDAAPKKYEALKDK